MTGPQTAEWPLVTSLWQEAKHSLSPAGPEEGPGAADCAVQSEGPTLFPPPSPVAGPAGSSGPSVYSGTGQLPSDRTPTPFPLSALSPALGQAPPFPGLMSGHRPSAASRFWKWPV